VQEGEKVFVAGSTHEGEEEIVFHVYRKILERYPSFKLIIVPRHIERGQDVLAIARQNGFSDVITMTDIRGGKRASDERVIIIDVIGELFKVYGLATVVFCGGSLVPRGGQNILEAAAWGKVVFYGPSMDDFMDEKALLEEAGAGIPVKNGDELFEKTLEFVKDSRLLLKKGDAAKEVVIANSGAARRYAEMVRRAIDQESPRKVD
jgi:3-deoxy-D-manno-octulosonic-acid transferase